MSKVRRQRGSKLRKEEKRKERRDSQTKEGDWLWSKEVPETVNSTDHMLADIHPGERLTQHDVNHQLTSNTQYSHFSLHDEWKQHHQ